MNDLDFVTLSKDEVEILQLFINLDSITVSYHKHGPKKTKNLLYKIGMGKRYEYWYSDRFPIELAQ